MNIKNSLDKMKKKKKENEKTKLGGKKTDHLRDNSLKGQIKCA